MRYVNLVPPRSCRAGSPLSPLLLSLPPRHEHPLLSQVLSRSTVAGWILTLFHLSIFSSRRERERERQRDEGGGSAGYMPSATLRRTRFHLTATRRGPSPFFAFLSPSTAPL